MTGSESIESRSESEVLLSTENVSKFYSQKQIFKNIDLKLGMHEFLTILGPSGCGKSTLLRILGNLEVPSSGKVNRSQRLQQCSFVFQEPRLLPWRNVLENTLLPLELQFGRNATSAQKAVSLLKLLKLHEAQLKFPQELSGGMKMRTAIARSLMLSPELLLFDEPFSALDEDTRFFLQQELRKLFEKSSFSIVFVTHSLEEALFISDRILIFQKSGCGFKEFIPPFAGLLSPFAHGTQEFPRNSSLKNEQFFFESLRALRNAVLEAQK